MPSIFISYRRSDTGAHAGRLRDRLVGDFGPKQVFFDFNNIDPGSEYANDIVQGVRNCDVLLALIGQGWLTAADDTGQPRLSNPKDLVRREISEAFAAGVRVIPVLVENATMPSRESLPEELAFLPDRNAYRLTLAEFDQQATALSRYLQGWRRPVRYAAIALFLLFAGLCLTSTTIDRPLPLNRWITGKKLVIVMDSPLLVYGRDASAGQPTGHVIRELLRDNPDLQLDVREEVTYPTWQREAELHRIDPDVIIIHGSSFYLETTPTDPDKRLISFLRDMKTGRARFLVYSRDRGLESQLIRLQEQDAQLLGRIHFFEVPGALNATFQNPNTGREFKAFFRKLLLD